MVLGPTTWDGQAESHQRPRAWMAHGIAAWVLEIGDPRGQGTEAALEDQASGFVLAGGGALEATGDDEER